MALSDRELEVLAQIEADLRGEQPEQLESETTTRAKTQVNPRRILAGVLIAIVGMASLIWGVSLGYSALGIGIAVCGVLVMTGGVYVMLSSPKQSGDKPKKQSQREKFANRH